MTPLNDKIIWLTGASSGIGEALTYALAKKNCKIIISARREKELVHVKNNCKHPKNIHVFPLDLTNYEDMPVLAKEAWGVFGKIDVLINNGGISQRSLIINTDFKVYERLMAVNYFGTLAITKALLPYMVTAKSGHITCVSSVMGKFSSPQRSGYCAAKHALHGFFDALRMEHQKDGIYITIICPGFVATDVAKNALTANGLPQEKNDTATKKGLSVTVFAEKMIKAMEQRKFEVYIGKKEALAVYLKRLFPKILHRVILRSEVT